MKSLISFIFLLFAGCNSLFKPDLEVKLEDMSDKMLEEGIEIEVHPGKHSSNHPRPTPGNPAGIEIIRITFNHTKWA